MTKNTNQMDLTAPNDALIQEPESLFAYQLEGANWLSAQNYGLLADEMGLGKTVQAIRGLDRIHAVKVLIITPSITRTNWHREFLKWSNKNRTYFVPKSLDMFDNQAEVTICSYEYATKNHKILCKFKWDALIVDEAHYLKEPTSKRTRAILGNSGVVRHAKRVWLLTGTPAPNHPGELWPYLITFGQTKLSYQNFIDYFCHTRKTSYGITISGAKSKKIPEIKELLKPIMLRRLKKDVMGELPDLHYRHIFIDPAPVDFSILPSFAKYYFPENREKELYKKVEKENKLAKDIFHNMKNPRTGYQLEALNALGDSISTLRRVIGIQKTPNAAIHIHNKIVQRGIGADFKVVVFAIHQDVIEGLRDRLKNMGHKPVVVYGKTPPDKRQKRIDAFQKDNKTNIFIGNIHAAGVGINLTRSSEVVFVEQDWVPGNNAQAVMRCHRIGQKNKVTVEMLALADSLDERITLLLKSKVRDLTRILNE